MRINPNSVPDILEGLQQSQQLLNTALDQVSSGKTVTVPSDNPVAAAAMVQNTIETGNVDQYTQNVTGVLSTVQSASSVLSNVVKSLTQAVSLGTEGANGVNTAANQQEIATQVQSIFTSVLAAANTSVSGSFLFGGTNTATPYIADPAQPGGYTYNGNNDTNSVQIGDQESIQVNLPGSQVFSNPNGDVLGSLNSLVTALQSGNTADIATATTAVNSALDVMSQQQVFYGGAEGQLNSQETYLQQDTVTLSSQENTLIGANLAKAATQLSQAETDNNAALAAAAKVLPNSLLNFLAPPA